MNTFPATLRDVNKASKLPTCEFVDLSAAMAKQWIENGLNWRRANKFTVENYTAEITGKHWKLTCEPIKFDIHGRMRDGSHRCHALIEADKICPGVSIQVLVVRGVPEDALLFLDQGRRRRFSELLEGQGEKGSKEAAAACQRFWNWNKGYACGTKMSTRERPNFEHLSEIFQEHEDLIRKWSPKSKISPIWSGGLFVYLMTRFEMVGGADRADEFYHMLKLGTHPNGLGLESDHPVHILRERINKRKETKNKMLEYEKTILTIKAWNLVQKGIPACTQNFCCRQDEDPEVLLEETQSDLLTATLH